jgi:hypothetical protein
VGEWCGRLRFWCGDGAIAGDGERRIVLGTLALEGHGLGNVDGVVYKGYVMYNVWRANVFWWWIGAKEERGVDVQVRNGADGWLGRRVAWSRVAPSRDRDEGLERGNCNHFIRDFD